jgi:hypothetical protein
MVFNNIMGVRPDRGIENKTLIRVMRKRADKVVSVVATWVDFVDNCTESIVVVSAEAASLPIDFLRQPDVCYLTPTDQKTARP